MTAPFSGTDTSIKSGGLTSSFLKSLNTLYIYINSAEPCINRNPDKHGNKYATEAVKRAKYV
jgi:hypothetical protein